MEGWDSTSINYSNETCATCRFKPNVGIILRKVFCLATDDGKIHWYKGLNELWFKCKPYSEWNDSRAFHYVVRACIRYEPTVEHIIENKEW